MKEEDKPLVSRRVAAVLSIFIIAALILSFYYLFWGMKAGTSMAGINPNTQATQSNLTEDKWQLSPLVGGYNIDKINQTPILVINCKYMLIGSFVPTYSADMERGNIGNALCAATHNTIFCSQFAGSPKGFYTINSSECNSGGKTLIYAFHSPSCGFSSAQRDVLNALKDEFPNQIELQYICTPVHLGDMAACSRDFLLKRYNA